MLVVRQSDGLPGQGWWVDGAQEAWLHRACGKGPKAAKLIRKLQRQAFDYWAGREA